MKTRILILILAIATLFVGCKNDDDGSPNLIVDGVWNLMNISGGVGGVDVDYELGLVVWTFQNNVLVVVNNAPLNMPGLLPSGTYSYSILQANSNNYLLVNDEEQGSLTGSGDVLNLDQNEGSNGGGNDGFQSRFER